MSGRSAMDSAGFTHQQISTTTAFLTFHNGTMGVGDDGVGVGNSCMCIDHKFGLGMSS